MSACDNQFRFQSSIRSHSRRESLCSSRDEVSSSFTDQLFHLSDKLHGFTVLVVGPLRLLKQL
eukprot:m.5971 g.5971  ORF g.5971 m.5971 type:complete len:63 (+) comp3773_c0_seq2:116-304(+)